MALNRRTMDQLASKIYFYWVRLHEVNGNDTGPLRAYVRPCSMRSDTEQHPSRRPANGSAPS